MRTNQLVGDRRSRASTLTDRQRQVLRMVGAGRTNRQIGRVLGISEGTVRKHLENAYERLGVNNRLSAARAADPLPRVSA